MGLIERKYKVLREQGYRVENKEASVKGRRGKSDAYVSETKSKPSRH